MNLILAIMFGFGIYIGVSQALQEDRQFRSGRRPGIRSSKSLFSFLFLD